MNQQLSIAIPRRIAVLATLHDGSVLSDGALFVQTGNGRPNVVVDCQDHLESSPIRIGWEGQHVVALASNVDQAQAVIERLLRTNEGLDVLDDEQAARVEWVAFLDWRRQQNGGVL